MKRRKLARKERKEETVHDPLTKIKSKTRRVEATNQLSMACGATARVRGGQINMKQL